MFDQNPYIQKAASEGVTLNDLEKLQLNVIAQAESDALYEEEIIPEQMYFIDKDKNYPDEIVELFDSTKAASKSNLQTFKVASQAERDALADLGLAEKKEFISKTASTTTEQAQVYQKVYTETFNRFNNTKTATLVQNRDLFLSALFQEEFNTSLKKYATAFSEKVKKEQENILVPSK